MRSTLVSPLPVAAMAACTVLLATSPAARAETDAGVAVVAEYRPAASRFNFSRPPAGKPVPVRIGGVVNAGDRITLPAGAGLTLQLGNGETASFKGPGTFTVPAGHPLGKVGAFFQSLPKLFDDEYRLAGTAAARGSKGCTEAERGTGIEVPILAPGARVVAGERDIPLAWRGGCPPFVVSLEAGPQRLAHREAVEGWQLRLDDLPLAAGRYTLSIVDSGAQRFATDLEAVPAGPAIPADLAANTTTLGISAQAAWLAEQDGGRWRLDSFERLRPLIRAGDPLAGSIGDALLWGSTTATPN